MVLLGIFTPLHHGLISLPTLGSCGQQKTTRTAGSLGICDLASLAQSLVGTQICPEASSKLSPGPPE